MLCHRVSLSHKLLNSTQKYQKLHEIVDEAMKKLEFEVGPHLAPQNIGRGLVNRLSVGAEVQRLCARGIEALDALLSSALSTNAQFQRKPLHRVTITVSMLIMLLKAALCLQKLIQFHPNS